MNNPILMYTTLANASLINVRNISYRLIAGTTNFPQFPSISFALIFLQWHIFIVHQRTHDPPRNIAFFEPLLIRKYL
jgi:hypothetical protein